MNSDIVIQLIMSIKDCPVDEQQKVMLAIVNDYRNGGPVNYPELSVLSQSVIFAAVKHLRETDQKMRETQAPICETMPKNLACAGTISPESEIRGNIKIIQKSAADDEKNPSDAAAADDESIAMDLISELSKAEHRYWLETLLVKLSWADKLQANLEWCLCYFKHHVLLQDKVSSIRNISDAKRYFAAFCLNATTGSRMKHRLDEHLIRISMDNGEALSSEAKFTQYMSVNFPRISAMIEPLTYQQSHLLIAVLGKDEVVRRLKRLENLRNLDHYVAALPLLQKASRKS